MQTTTPPRSISTMWPAVEPQPQTAASAGNRENHSMRTSLRPVPFLRASSPPATSGDRAQSCCATCVASPAAGEVLRGVSLEYPRGRDLRSPRPQRRPQGAAALHDLHPPPSQLPATPGCFGERVVHDVDTGYAGCSTSHRRKRPSIPASPRPRTCPSLPSCTGCHALSAPGRVAEALEAVGLTGRKDDRVSSYSGGMRRRLQPRLCPGDCPPPRAAGRAKRWRSTRSRVLASGMPSAGCARRAQPSSAPRTTSRRPRTCVTASPSWTSDRSLPVEAWPNCLRTLGRDRGDRAEASGAAGDGRAARGSGGRAEGRDGGQRDPHLHGPLPGPPRATVPCPVWETASSAPASRR